MKRKLLFIVIFSFFIISCHSDDKAQAVRLAHFRTSKNNGTYFFIDKNEITPNKGLISIKNISPYTALISLHNKTNKSKLEYVALLESGEVVSYNNLDVNSEYFIGVRITSTLGSKDCDFVICTDFDSVPLEYFDRNVTIDENKNKFRNWIENIEGYCVL